MLIKMLILIFGFLLGFVVCSATWSGKMVGVLRRINDPDEPECGPYLYLELDRDKLPAMRDGHYILMQVKDDSNIVRFPRK